MNKDPSAPRRENVLRTEHWRVAHAFNTRLPGWLIIVASRHVTSLADLTAEAAGELGRLQWALSLALRDVVGCDKTYVMQFSEAEGFPHLHVHLVPRMPDLSEGLKGPEIFQLLGVPPEDRVSDQEMDRLSEEVGRVASSHFG